MGKPALVKARRIEQAIVIVRGIRVLLDADLAALYGVSTRVLVQAVKRNRKRFPKDFMLQLTDDEVEILRSQSVISSSDHGGRRYAPYAFTEQGVAMLSSVLRSKRAIHANIEIMRAFVRLRRLLRPSDALAKKIDEMEEKYDTQFGVVFEAIRDLMRPPPASRHRIGFRQ
jgi:ORF6N domain-containing protein